MLKTASLTPEMRSIICDKHTEYPNTGLYTDFEGVGSYLCRNCGIALFRAQHKFHSGCGWPSFDNAIVGTILEQPDSDGRRIEILCKSCNAHLGHVFRGEGMTLRDTRHCVNSLALDFVADIDVVDTEEAILAAGCFWGVEYYLQNLAGVLKTEVGYSGGNTDNPTYKDVCSHTTQHLEAIRVIYNPHVLSYEKLLKYFFEIHDFSQTNGQGPDIGNQYLSAIFYYNDTQYKTAQLILQELTKLDYQVATKLIPVNVFWPAEDYHQDYYTKTQKQPYCHSYQKRFIK